MGYMKYDAIVVTGMLGHVRRARETAYNLGLEVTNIEVSRVNSEASFLIIPDGSKEGWPDSNKAEERRKLWVDWARKQRAASVNPLWIDWVWVSFGGDDPQDARLVDFHGKE